MISEFVFNVLIGVFRIMIAIGSIQLVAVLLGHPDFLYHLGQGIYYMFFNSSGF